MMTDIEIAQSVQMKPITDIAKSAGIDEKYLEQYGKYKAKVDLSLLKESKKEDGKLVLVTAITPLPRERAKQQPPSVLPTVSKESAKMLWLL